MIDQRIEDSYPLSPLQQGMLFHSLYAPASGVDIEQIVCTLPEPLEAELLEQSWQQLVRRHPILRTSFRWENLDEPVQEVHARGNCPVTVEDWRDLPAQDRQERLDSYLRRDRAQGFALDHLPLMRVALFRLAGNEYRLIWTFHHILLDGRSFPLLLNELFEIYEALERGQTPALDPSRPYRDYIDWLQQQDFSAAQPFWQHLLRDFSKPTPFVVDKRIGDETARPDIPSSNSAQRGEYPSTPPPLGGKEGGLPLDERTYEVQHRHLSATLTATLQQVAHQHQLTLNTLVQGAWALLLNRYSGEPDVVFGATRAGRRLALGGEGTEEMVGLFINTLPVRARLSPEASILSCLKALRAQSVVVRQFEHTPLIEIQKWSEVSPSLPLFESLLVFESYRLTDRLQAQGGCWQNRHFEVLEQTNYPLTLAVYGGERLLLRFEYDTARFDPDTIARMLGHLETLLQGFTDDITRQVSDIPLLTEVEQQQMLVDWNATQTTYPRHQCFHHLFEAQAAQTPDAAAVIYEDQTLTYDQLNRQAGQLARHLQSLGVGPDVLVGVFLERSSEMVVSLLAILKAGGAYLPLNLDYPTERLAFMVRDAGVSILITRRELWQAANLAQALEIEHLVNLDTAWPQISLLDDSLLAGKVTPEHLAYVIYTSGSTGQPKGTMISHRGLVNYLSWGVEAYEVAAGNGTLLHSPLGFDLTVTALFSPLLVGRSVQLISEDGSGTSPEAFRLPAALRQVHNFSLVKVTPAHLEILNQQIPVTGAAGLTRRFIIGGEALMGEALAFWQAHAPETKLVNEYGPTETVVGCCIYEVAGDQPISGPVPIGRPIANTQLYILDSHLQPVPAGVPGELFIGGHGVARGYLHRPDLTAEKFIPDPFSPEPGARLYKSGDLARYRPDGVIEFLGRIDHQVKIRGFRIELGEIEALLAHHPAVQEVVVEAREDIAGQKRLAAYVVPVPGMSFTPHQMRDYLQSKLPDYMLPAALVLLDALPLTPNGKVDRKALPAPDIARPELDETYAPPQTHTEQLLAEIWAALLGVDRVGIHDSFFELGGDSIISLQIIARAGQAGIRLTPRQIFQHRTIAKLAAVADQTPAIAAEQKLITGAVPLTSIQRWFFEQNLPDPHHWNQSMLLEVQESLDPSLLAQVVAHLTTHHDALRLRFNQTQEGWRQVNAAPDASAPFTRIDLSNLPDSEQETTFTRLAAEMQAGLHLSDGPLLRVCLFEFGPAKPPRLLMVVHHLVIDGVSWRILLEDFETAYRQLREGQAVKLPPKTTSFKRWAGQLAAYAGAGLVERELDFWLGQFRQGAPPLPVEQPAIAGRNTQALARVVSVSLSEEETRALLQDVPPVYHTYINDVLLTALLQAFQPWTGSRSLLLDLEGHGREEIGPEIDLSRTVGWFTTIFPVYLALPDDDDPGEALKSIKEQLRCIPHKGIGYGVLRYLAHQSVVQQLRNQPRPQVSFNYLGQFDQILGQRALLSSACGDSGLFGLNCEAAGPPRAPSGSRAYLLEINGSIAQERLQFDWTFSEKIHHPATIERLAQRFLDSLRALIAHCQSPAAGGYTPSDFSEAGLTQAELDALLDSLPGETVEDIYPLSPAQQGILFHTRYTPQTGVYFNQRVLSLHGPLDVDALERAWQRVAARHQPLRALFRWKDTESPLQIVLRQATIPWGVHDLSDELDVDPAAWLEQWLQQDRQQGFDLNHPPLTRLSLFKIDDDRFTLVWSFHHIILGGWSTALILKEVFSFYHTFSQGRDLQLEPARPYRDYIAWLRQQDLAAAETYWRDILRGFTSPTVVGINQRRETDTTAVFDQQDFEIDAATATALRQVGRQQGLTLNTIFQGAWALLLSRYSGEVDVVFGTTVSGRPAELRDVEHMVGLFINTLPVRVQVAPQTQLLPWLNALQNRQVTMRQYESTPLVEIQQWSDVPANRPLFETLLVFENYPAGAIKSQNKSQAGQIEIHHSRDIEMTNYPLNVVIMPGETVTLRIMFDRSRFEPESITRLGGHLQTLLAAMARAPEQSLADLPLLTEAERRRLLVEWNHTTTDYPRRRCIHHLFEAQAEQTPDAVAVRFEDQHLTYRALNHRANRLARYLRRMGVGLETPVGLCVERSLEMVVGLVGILKAGGVYVPLDPAYPQERLCFMLEDIDAPVLLTQKKLAANLPPHQAKMIYLDADWPGIAAGDDENLSVAVEAHNLAYIMYTSGSTGRPKGTGICHRSVVRLVKNTNYFEVTPDDRFLQLAPISFDAATLEIWAPLLHGAELVVFSARPPSLAELARTLETANITTLWLTTGLFHQMVEAEPESLKSMRYLMTGGDVVSVSHAKRALQLRQERGLLNCYGPTENTTFTTFYPMTAPDQIGASVSIGRPITNTRVYVLDHWLQPVPVGVPGELYVGGDGLARDYWNRPELTAEKFIPDPFGSEPGARLYKTGDLVRYLPDGNLEFLGRIDSQVKIRGFRVEPGETEMVVGRHPAVQDATVVVREDRPGEKRLVAYIVPRSGETFAVADVRDFLQDQLPDYMLPGAFVTMESLPLTPNGKINRQKLPQPDQIPLGGNNAPVAPRTWTETILAEMWADLLGLEQVGVQDNFFEWGGHSLLAVRLMARIQKIFGQELPLAVLFEDGTIEQLARVLDRGGQPDAPGSPLLVPIQPSGVKLPLFFVHPVGGNVLSYVPLARTLGAEQPFYGLQARGLTGTTAPHTQIEAMAADYIDAIREVQPQGPYCLGGWSMGGLAAFEMARQLQAREQRVSLLALLDTTFPTNDSTAVDDVDLLIAFLTDLARTLAKDLQVTYNDMQGLTSRARLDFVFERARQADLLPPDVGPEALSTYFDVFKANVQAMAAYRPQPYKGKITLFQAEKTPADSLQGWKTVVDHPPAIFTVPGDHYTMLTQPEVKVLARQLSDSLSQATDIES